MSSSDFKKVESGVFLHIPVYSDVCVRVAPLCVHVCGQGLLEVCLCQGLELSLSHEPSALASDFPAASCQGPVPHPLLQVPPLFAPLPLQSLHQHS